MYDRNIINSKIFKKFTNVSEESKHKKAEQSFEIIWLNVISMVVLHLAAMYGFYLIITGHVQIYSIIFGWLLVKKHKDVIEKGKNIDMSDLEQGGVVMFQKKYYVPLVILGTFVVPTVIPTYFWNEPFFISFFAVAIFSYTVSVNITWYLNSGAHLFETKPYDKNIGPTQNVPMIYLALGEGFHNYHHTFPWDYKAAEFGNDGRNLTTYFIDYFAKMGWATELKMASPELIKKRAFRTGDGTWDGDLADLKRNFPEHVTECIVWGWGDKNISIEEQNEIIRFNLKE